MTISQLHGKTDAPSGKHESSGSGGREKTASGERRRR
jgi:hypothetical protein